MKIAFWSNVHGQTTTTSNALAVTSMLALNQSIKMLLTHNHYRHSTIERTLLGYQGNRSDLSTLDDMGIDAVSRFIKFNQVESSCVENYATTVVKGRLDLLTGTRQTNESLYYKDVNHVIELILKEAQSQYDLLVVDVSAGDNHLSEKILENCDLVLVNLNQNIHVLEDFFSGQYSFKKCLYLISMYDITSSFTLKNLVRKYPQLKGRVIPVPYTRSFGDALNKGDVVDYMARNKNCTKEDKNFQFIQSIKEIEGFIVKEFDVDDGGEMVS